MTTLNFSRIEENQLWENLTKRIQEEVTCCQDHDRNEQQKQRRKDNLMKVINSINDQPDNSTKYSDLTVGSDEKLAVERINHWEAKDVSPFIARLEEESKLSYLDQLDQTIRPEEEYPVAPFIWIFLKTNENHPNISSRVKKLQARIREITLERIQAKNPDTKLEDMARTELLVLESEFLKATDDSTISRLYWLVFETKLDKNIELFKQFGIKRKEREPFYIKMSFYADSTTASRIPSSVHEKSRKLKRDYEKINERTFPG